MEKPYLVSAPLNITYEAINDENREFCQNEFNSLSEVEADPIGHWLKMKRAKGETQDSDEVILELLVELNRKIDRLEKIIKGDEKELKPLKNSGFIDNINFTLFQIKDNDLIPNTLYYGRVELKVYPQRDIPIFFKAVSNNLAEIDKIHNRDERDWGAYFRARERVMIRERRR